MSDLRLAARTLIQAKGWPAVVVLLLALGIGANTALFSALNGLLIRKLPVRDPDTLVRFRYAGPNHVRTDVLVYGSTPPDARGRQVEPTFSYPMYLALRAANQTLTDLFTWAPLGRINVVVDGRAEVATGLFASGNYYQALGVTARLGRTITPDDDRPTAAPVAVISHQYWMSRFGGSPDAIGASAYVNTVPVTIVGVLPASFTGADQVVGTPPDVSVPLALEPQINLQPSTLQSSLLGAANFWWLHVMGRVKPGVTAEQVHGNLAGVFQQAARSGFDSFLSALPPEERSRDYLRERTAVPEFLVDSGSRGIYDATATDVRAVTMLTAIVALVLLVVCANIANLVVSRSTVRQKDISIRLALGATRGRLVRLLLTESLLLAAAGGALGLLVGWWGQQLLPGAAARAWTLDWRVALFVAGVSAATGILFGLMPALRATRTDVHPGLKESSKTVVRTRNLVQRALVVAQVTISIVLLVGAGLFLRTLQNLRQVDVGFNPRNVLVFNVSPALNRYPTRSLNSLYDRIGERLRAVAGVQAVAWSNPGLMSARRFQSSIFVHGRTYAAGQRETISGMIVSPSFFETMGIPLAAGRAFTAADAAGTPPVIVINEAAARRYFPGESAIGRRIGSSLEESGRIEIVGILRDAKYNTIRDAAAPTMYRSYLQSPQGSATFEVRTAGDPIGTIAAVRDAVRQVDPNVPLINVTTQMAELESRFAQEKVFAQAYSLFGGLALVVASVGLFGLMSYSVARRTNEIGVRMALGARRQDVLALVIRESMMLVAAGSVIGLVVAMAGSRFVSHLLFGLAPTDPATMAGAVVVMGLVSALAGYLPARRAARVDPMVALRYE